MSKQIALKTNDLSTPDEAHDRREYIKLAKRQCNHGLLVIGKSLEEGHIKQDWVALGYENENDWITDPHGIDMRPRTARAARRIWRLWVNRLAKLSVKEEDIITIDHCKLEAMATRIENEPDDEKAVELLEQARTLPLREIIQQKEDDDYFVFDGRGRVGKWLNEKSGAVVHLSQVIGRIDASAQNWNSVFGNRVVEIKIRCKKEEEK